MADEGYNDSIFVQVPEDNLRCPICLGVARDPVLTACGHLFCQKCFQKLPRLIDSVECPIDRRKLKDDEVMLDKRTKRQLMQLHVRCEQHEMGCKEIVELQHLEDHMRTCGYVFLQCPNGCNQVLTRSELAQHQKDACANRKATCKNCLKEMLFHDLQEHKRRDCPNSLVACSLCESAYKRREEHRHLLEACPGVVIICEYSEVGCHFSCPRGKMPDHVEKMTSNHLRLLLKKSQDHHKDHHTEEILGKRSDQHEKEMDAFRAENEMIKASLQNAKKLSDQHEKEMDALRAENEMMKASLQHAKDDIEALRAELQKTKLFFAHEFQWSYHLVIKSFPLEEVVKTKPFWKGTCCKLHFEREPVRRRKDNCLAVYAASSDWHRDSAVVFTYTVCYDEQNSSVCKGTIRLTAQDSRKLLVTYKTRPQEGANLTYRDLLTENERFYNPVQSGTIEIQYNAIDPAD